MSYSQRKILLIEDDIGDAKLLMASVNKEFPGFEFVHVESMREAYEKINSGSFDVIVTDLNLPDSQGLDTVSEIYQKNNKLPIIVLTGMANEDIGISSLSKGALDYLTKDNIDPGLFARSIRYAIERKRLELFKDELLSNVSHELRTPLTIIRESISQIIDGLLGEVNERQMDYLNKSLNNIDRLKHIINNLLDVSKIQEGKLELYKNETDLCGLVNEVYEYFLPQYEKQGLYLKKDLPPESVKVLIDKEKIFQVLNNLVGNAMKFTKKGGAMLSIRAESEFVKCCIADTGIGISQKDLPKMFTKFEQFGRIDGPGEKGTGLGLAIAKGIVDLHGGNITVKSQQGQGSNFTVLLPIREIRDVAITGIKKVIRNALIKHSLFTMIVCMVHTDKEISAEGSDQFKNEIFRLKNYLNKKIYRQGDEIQVDQQGLLLILPNTTEEQSQYVLKRIKANVIDFAAQSKHIDAEKFRYKLLTFPHDGLTEDELVSKLTLIEEETI
ncbi:MAG: response regulator [Candidatus Omnitrophica bacterium]|nr:response regulator [Candidatus Omnitrophota bacterium]